MKLSTTDWQRHIAQQRQSPLSITAYCAKHGLPPSRWYYWQSKLKESRANENMMIPVVPPTRPLTPSVVPLELIQSLNAQIRMTAAGERAVLVDLYGALASDVTRYIGSDGIHPTEAGYVRIAETFFAAIRANLESGP
jgi:lysophospholipase L1-like esterase